MILAAGLGTRLRPLTDLRAKPALPIRGRAVISLLLEFLDRNAVREVMINLHYLPQTILKAVEEDSPPGMEISWSEESTPLGTGGGIRRAAAFLGGEEDCVVLAGDMLLDIDLRRLVEEHRRTGRDATLILREDPRAVDFGTIGVDAEGQITRVGKRMNRDGETRSGLFTGARVFSRSVFKEWPEAEVFEDLRDWLIPGTQAGKLDAGAAFVDVANSVWEPVGTPGEYLRVNLTPPVMPTLGGGSGRWGGEIEISGRDNDVILGAGARLGAGACLARSVVWAGESVPARFAAEDGVFAGGRFIDCGPRSAALGQSH